MILTVMVTYIFKSILKKDAIKSYTCSKCDKKKKCYNNYK